MALHNKLEVAYRHTHFRKPVTLQEKRYRQASFSIVRLVMFQTLLQENGICFRVLGDSRGLLASGKRSLLLVQLDYPRVSPHLNALSPFFHSPPDRRNFQLGTTSLAETFWGLARSRHLPTTQHSLLQLLQSQSSPSPY